MWASPPLRLDHISLCGAPASGTLTWLAARLAPTDGSLAGSAAPSDRPGRVVEVADGQQDHFFTTELAGDTETLRARRRLRAVVDAVRNCVPRASATCRLCVPFEPVWEFRSSRGGSTCSWAGMPNVDSNQINQLTGAIIAAAIKVHKALGPGLLESAYSVCLAVRGLRRSQFHVDVQRRKPQTNKRGLRARDSLTSWSPAVGRRPDQPRGTLSARADPSNPSPYLC